MELKQQEKEENIVEFEPKLKLITGGKEPPTGNESWLQRMSVGDCFTAKMKGQWQCGLFRLGQKMEKTYVLQSPSSPEPMYVDPVAFCNAWILFENLGNISRKEGDENEQSDWNDTRPSDEDGVVERHVGKQEGDEDIPVRE